METFLLPIGMNLLTCILSQGGSFIALKLSELKIHNIALRKCIRTYRCSIQNWYYFLIGFAFVGIQVSSILFWISITVFVIALGVSITLFIQDKSGDDLSVSSSLRKVNPLLAALITEIVRTNNLNEIESATYDALVSKETSCMQSCPMGFHCETFTGDMFSSCANRKDCYTNSRIQNMF